MNPKTFRYAEIALNRPMRMTYHYRVPPALRSRIAPGKRVRVSFGRQQGATGYCVGLSTEVKVPESKLKDIQEVLDEEPLLSEKMLELTKRVAEHYCCSWGEVLQAALPRGVRSASRSRTLRVVEPAKSSEDLKKWIEEHQNSRQEKRARVLRVLLDEVQGEVTPFELAGMCGVTRGVVDGLRKSGLVRYAERAIDDDLARAGSAGEEKRIVVNEEQRRAIEVIHNYTLAAEFKVILVQGVTGSGKTEVYLRAIEEVVSRNQQVIVLVPEISLTPQTVRRFRSRFEKLAVLHSRQTEAQRREQWKAIRDGQAQVVIGARSAIFAPVPSLGMVVVDEEHENSFKQDNAPRYNARDLAVMRGKLENAVVLLGSATPSLESYANWSRGRYDRVVLSKRVEDRPLPPVDIVDMNLELAGAKYWSFLSRKLQGQMEEVLERGEQVLLFLNRRGFSTLVRCFRCGSGITCDHCAASMTYYKRRHRAVCLYCRKEIEPPELCPVCKIGKLRYLGIGTEKVEEEVSKRFPDYRVVRMDSDTMRGHGAVEKTLDDFREGHIRVLVGTQMISKGLDLPNVTLVGVISADTSMLSADFRAFERTFQMVAQVAGRAGRGDRPGRVIVQTFSPEHHSIQLAAKHDFEGFASRELKDREQAEFPPFSRSLRVCLSGPREREVEATGEGILDRMRQIAPESVRFLGPVPCAIPVIRDQYRWHALVFAREVGMIRYLASAIDPYLGRRQKVKVALDVDPLNLF